MKPLERRRERRGSISTGGTAGCLLCLAASRAIRAQRAGRAPESLPDGRGEPAVWTSRMRLAPASVLFSMDQSRADGTGDGLDQSDREAGSWRPLPALRAVAPNCTRTDLSPPPGAAAAPWPRKRRPPPLPRTRRPAAGAAPAGRGASPRRPGSARSRYRAGIGPRAIRGEEAGAETGHAGKGQRIGDGDREQPAGGDGRWWWETWWWSWTRDCGRARYELERGLHRLVHAGRGRVVGRHHIGTMPLWLMSRPLGVR